MNNHTLEAAAKELLDLFEITITPVPIEMMLQQPRNNLWQEVDLNQMSGTFLSVKDLYSPRMSLARLLARHVASSEWGKTRGLGLLLEDEAQLHAFARMLIMPSTLVTALSKGARNTTAISMQFEVPEEDARLRLEELADLL